MKNLLYLLLLTPFITFAQTPCVGGNAGGYPCNNLDLLANLPNSSMGGGEGNDSWGWTDPNTGNEYAIMGTFTGTSFIDISDPVSPVYLGNLPTQTNNSSWRDIKVYNNHAFIVSEASGHGMQVFDLTRLTSVVSPPVTFTNDAHLSAFGSAHNIAINEETGYAYVIGAGGAGGYSGGPIFINIQNPTSPVVEGGYSADGYTHDAQIVIYHGSDTEHVGKEILFASNEDTVTVIDVTDKSNPIQLSRSTYAGDRYTHQGWLTYDHDYYIFNDELDETNIGHNTRSRIMDFTNLDAPVLAGIYNGPTAAIDHNGYTKGNRYYMANYRAGMRILDMTNVASGSLTEVSYFDTYPASNSANFNGAWNVYPYFSSGVMVISDIERGLFLVKDPNYDATPPTVVCQNITVTLDASGTATIDALQVDGGSTDNGIIFDRIIDKTTFTCADIGPNNVELTILDGNENKATCTAIVTVQAATTTYSGAWDNGAPNAGSKAVFVSNYDTASGSIEACECEIESTSTVTVNAGEYVKVDNDIVVDGNLFVAHEGSVVQTYDSAVTTNNGNITVRKTTPSLTPQGFMIMGSPMTAETREGVYGAGRRVLHHITGNFVPNPSVEVLSPGTANWADDNGDNWGIHTGIVNGGEGYFVRPQPDQSTGGSFDLDYTLGTLNNGVINYSVLFNNNQNDSPNMMANPYASAIDAEVFFDAPENAMINEVYFWNHITPPLTTYPGYQPNNFSMGDISVYVEGSGGIAAANGGGIPTQFIASGQGFGVKPTSAGTAVFNNSMRVTGPNDTYRIQENNRQRIWLDVSNETYKLGANMLVAFMDNATDAFEEYDSKRIATPVSLYSVIETGEELGVQGRSAFSEEQIIPLGFASMIEEEQTFSISIRQLEGEDFSTVNVFLVDNVLETTTNLSEEDYEFTSNEGTFNDRFELSFKEKSILGTSDALENIAVYPNPTQNFIQVEANNSTVNSIEIFDVRGRQVATYNFREGESIQINVSELETAMYFIEINTNNGTITKRILKK